MGWYTIHASGTATVPGETVLVNGTETYYPLNSYYESLTCTGSVYCPQNSTGNSAYTQGTFDSIGTLYDIVAAFVIVAAILGGLAAVIAFTTKRVGSKWVLGLALVAVLLALLAPTIPFLAQPSVLASQVSSSHGSGPEGSFFGSCAGSGCGSTIVGGETLNASWGPSVGWYLALASAATLIAGLLLARKPRDRSDLASVYEEAE